MRGDINTGIRQSGSGRIDNSGSVAVGHGASASVTQVSPAHGDGSPDGMTPEEALAHLRAMLADHGRELTAADRAQARGEVEEMADALASENPDRGHLAESLARLVTALGSVAALATAGESLRRALAPLLG